MENFKYQDESDIPRDTYMGLKMQIGLTEKSIKYTKINLNKAKYSYEKKRYEKRLEYLTNLLDIYKDELNKFDKNEGIHLVAYVKDKQTGEATTIEDNDYNSKQDFENDLKANGYNNISILDNRDLYLLDNTNYTRVSQLKKDLQQLKKDINDAKDKYPALYKSYVKEYDRLKTIYDNVMKVSLTEGYVLKGILDGKSFDIAYNEDEGKLQKFRDELQPSHSNVDMYIIEESAKKTEHKYYNKNKLEEVSRNELLVKTKGETVDRYNKAAGYRGFSIYNIDTSNILRYNSLVVICRVGKYNTAVELEEILYWIQIVAENTKSYTKNQINTKVVTQAIMNSIDGLNIRVDCECGDWKYRMAYQATQWGYKYGTPENRPANIRNPEGRGALCKHLTSILGNKRWLQQVTSTLLNWLEANIDEVNRFLGLSGDRVLTLPNELARQNAKLSWQNRQKGDKDDDTTNQENAENIENQDNNTNNIQGNNPSTNAINNTGDVEEQTDETEQEDNEE